MGEIHQAILECGQLVVSSGIISRGALITIGMFSFAPQPVHDAVKDYSLRYGSGPGAGSEETSPRTRQK